MRPCSPGWFWYCRLHFHASKVCFVTTDSMFPCFPGWLGTWILQVHLMLVVSYRCLLMFLRCSLVVIEFHAVPKLFFAGNRVACVTCGCRCLCACVRPFVRACERRGETLRRPLASTVLFGCVDVSLVDCIDDFWVNKSESLLDCTYYNGRLRTHLRVHARIGVSKRVREQDRISFRLCTTNDNVRSCMRSRDLGRPCGDPLH